MEKYPKMNEIELPLTEQRRPGNTLFRKQMKTMHPFTRLLLILLTLCIFVGISLISIFYLHANTSDPLRFSEYTDAVETDCGKVVGVKESYNDKQTYVFKGIPYAKPPVGDLRWKPPQGLKKSDDSCWKGVFKAKEFGNICVQAQGETLSGSEDCLYLNVWTPTLDSSKNLPVFFWIHGGSLIDLYGNFPGYSPDSEFVTSMNVVAVSMNYRLNAFGFLTLKELWDEGKSYGNYGIMDQIVVLKWVQKNIKNFGGDPNSVTIIGQSSGGTSIFGLLASPLADSLFHKAIPMSGSPKFSIDYKQASKDNRVFINRTRCRSVDNSSLLKQCLYSLTADEIFKALPLNVFPSWATPLMYDFPKKGVLDGAVIVTDPVVITIVPQSISEVSLKNKKSILTGTMGQEVEFSRKLNFDSFNELESLLSERLTGFSSKFPPIVLSNLYNSSEYWQEKPEYLYLTITTDSRVTCSNNIIADSFAKNSKLQSYRYVVTNRPSSPMNVSFSPYKIVYSSHLWDSIALFNFTMVRSSGFEPSITDIEFRDNLRNVVKEFMVSGNLSKFDWHSNQTALFLRNASLSILQSHYHEKECQFWNNKSNGFLPYQWIN